MARASSAALFTLIVLLLPFIAFGQNTGKTANKRSKLGTQTVESPRWTAGYSLWSESLKMRRSDGQTYSVLSSMRTLSMGYQMDWLQRKTGWFLEAQGHLGDATSASQDSRLTYFQSGASLMGASLTAMKHWNFERPRLFLGLGLTTLWRKIQFQAPASYSMGGDQAFVNYLSVDFSFPVASRFEIVQQFGIPVGGNGHFWQIGLRRQ